MLRVPLWFNLRFLKGLLENQHNRVISLASQQIPEGKQYLSLETKRLEIEGRSVRQVAIVNEQEHLLANLSLDLESIKEISTENRDEDKGDGAVSLKQASDAMRSKLTSDAVLVSLSANGVPSLLGLKEGADFQSHLSLIDVFTVGCNHCQKIKRPSRKLVEEIGATLPNVNTNQESNKTADRATMCLRLFKHYLKIKDDNQAWEAMTQRLLKGETSTTTASIPVVNQETEEVSPSPSANDIDNTVDTPSTEEKSDNDQDVIPDKKIPSKRPVYAISREFLHAKGHRKLQQVSLIDEDGGILLNASIKQKKSKNSKLEKAESEDTVNASTNENSKLQSMGMFKVIRKLKYCLPKHGVLIGMGIGREIKVFGLKQNQHYHFGHDLAKLFGKFICPVCHQSSSYSLDQISTACLHTKSDEGLLNALDNAKRMLKIYKQYQNIKNNPKELQQLKERMTQTPKASRMKMTSSMAT